MPTSVRDMLSSANDAVPRVSVDAAKRLIDTENALLVDVRDPSEVAQNGKLEGAINVSRGMLEFRADETTPYHNPEFRLDRPLILYCASGGRSALSGKVMQEMGYQRVYNLGGFSDALEGGFPSEGPDRQWKEASSKTGRNR